MWLMENYPDHLYKYMYDDDSGKGATEEMYELYKQK